MKQPLIKRNWLTQRPWTALALACLLAPLTGCGGAQPPSQVAQPPSGAPRDGYHPGAMESADSAAEAPSPLSEAESSYDYGASRASQPQQRPGLATEWGESRDSRIQEVFFQRQRSNTPAGLVSVFYNDATGIEMATTRSGHEAYPRSFPIRGGALTVSITDKSGDPLPVVHSGGRDYVIGDAGDRYQIRIKNYTAGRFEIVATVDGLDVLDGQEGSFSKRGYLVSPWSSLTIEGFRESSETVRAFRFGSVETSYAARRGKARNIGVIGVAVFEEQGFSWGYDDDELMRRRRANPFPDRFAPPPPPMY